MRVPYLLAIAGVVLSLTILGWVWWRSRTTPEERERRRRLAVHREGRIVEATIGDVEGTVLFYSYCVSGVEYNASQDVSGVLARLPASSELLIGPAACKYQPLNPANSIVICEEWSGIRFPERTT